MKKIIILGPAGAGKTTLANRLAEKYELSVFHFDSIKWNPEESGVLPEHILETLSNIAFFDNYVIEGSSSFLTNLFDTCTDILFLNIDKEYCLANLNKRGPSSELPPEESGVFDEFLASYADHGYEVCMRNLNNILNSLEESGCSYNVTILNSLEEVYNFDFEE